MKRARVVCRCTRRSPRTEGPEESLGGRRHEGRRAFGYGSGHGPFRQQLEQHRVHLHVKKQERKVVTHGTKHALTQI